MIQGAPLKQNSHSHHPLYENNIQTSDLISRCFDRLNNVKLNKLFGSAYSPHLSLKIDKSIIYSVFCAITRIPDLCLLPVNKSYQLIRARIGCYLLKFYSTGSLILLNEVVNSNLEEQLSTVDNLLLVISQVKPSEVSISLNKRQYEEFVSSDIIQVSKLCKQRKNEMVYIYNNIEISIDLRDHFVSFLSYSTKLMNCLLSIIDGPAYDPPDTKKSDNPSFIIGQDEVGTSEIFQRMVTCGVAIRKSHIRYLRLLGLRDSKLYQRSFDFTDYRKSILRMADSVNIINPTHQKVEELEIKFRNEGKSNQSLLAWSHARVLKNLILKIGDSTLIEQVTIDKFNEDLTRERLCSMIPEFKSMQIIQRSQAENEFIAVAAAAIIAKDRQ